MQHYHKLLLILVRLHWLDKDLATALRTGSQPIFDELGRRRDFEENIGGILAQQVLADEATQGAMIAEAAKTGDPNAVLRMQKYFDGYNEGVTNILPIDAKELE